MLLVIHSLLHPIECGGKFTKNILYYQETALAFRLILMIMIILESVWGRNYALGVYA